MSIASKLENAPRGIYIGVAVLVLLLGVSLIGYLLFAPKTELPQSSTKSMQTRAEAGSVGGAGNPQYNQMIEELNKSQAQEAARSGESYVPIPIGDEKPAEENKAPEPVRVAPISQAPESAPRAARRSSPRGDDAGQKAMEADLKGLMGRNPRIFPGATAVLYTEFEQPTEADATPEVAIPLTPAEARAYEGLKAGKLLYAVNDLAINSDAPSPVMATVAMGEFRGSKVFGAFSRNSTTLVIAFSRLVLPGGEEIEIEGVAVDPSTSKTDVASRSDTHFFERWGSLVAASFLDGFGNAMSSRNTEVYSTGDVVVESSNKTYTDVSLEAVGRVGERAATQIERGFDRPPTVYLNAGQPLGVLILGVGDK